MGAPGAAARGQLVATGVHVRLGAVHVLGGVDLAVRVGETLAPLGTSGCRGTSGLLRVLRGFQRLDAARLTLDGAAVPGPGPQRGVVAQAGTLLPCLTVRQDVAFGPHGAGRRDIDAVVAERFAATGLEDVADALPRDLSGGVRQRAAITQVPADRPPVLLLDEPFGALGARTRLREHEWLRPFPADRDTTTVLVVHDVAEALLPGDRLDPVLTG